MLAHPLRARRRTSTDPATGAALTAGRDPGRHAHTARHALRVMRCGSASPTAQLLVPIESGATGRGYAFLASDVRIEVRSLRQRSRNRGSGGNAARTACLPAAGIGGSLSVGPLHAEQRAQVPRRRCAVGQHASVPVPDGHAGRAGCHSRGDLGVAGEVL